MIEKFFSHSAYWFLAAIFAIGLYGMIVKQNLMKKLIGLVLLQSSIILFFVASTSKWKATVPVIDPQIGSSDPSLYINPLPHTLMLTAIVVSVATTGVAIALLIMIYRCYRTLDEPTLLERMR